MRIYTYIYIYIYIAVDLSLHRDRGRIWERERERARYRGRETERDSAGWPGRWLDAYHDIAGRWLRLRHSPCRTVPWQGLKFGVTLDPHR